MCIILYIYFQDTLPLVDQQLLYTCCPYLGESELFPEKMWLKMMYFTKLRLE